MGKPQFATARCKCIVHAINLFHATLVHQTVSNNGRHFLFLNGVNCIIFTSNQLAMSPSDLRRLRLPFICIDDDDDNTAPSSARYVHLSFGVNDENYGANCLNAVRHGWSVRQRQRHPSRFCTSSRRDAYRIHR